MSEITIMDKLRKQKELLEKQGYSVAYVALYGSQNYGMEIHTEDYQSDVDMKAVVVPTLHDLISNSKPISTVVDTEWGQCDIKDIRSYFQTLLKANPAYIETLFTKYYIVDSRFKEDFYEIHELKEELVHALRAQMIRAMYGMMCEKEKAMCHPYPTIAHRIEQFGFDGKQVSHIIRLYTMMKDYYINRHFMSDCFTPTTRIQEMLDAKTNIMRFEDAKILVKEFMKKGKQLKEAVLNDIDESKIDYSVKERFLQLSQSIIKDKIELEIKEGK